MSGHGPAKEPRIPQDCRRHPGITGERLRINPVEQVFDKQRDFIAMISDMNANAGRESKRWEAAPVPPGIG